MKLAAARELLQKNKEGTYRNIEAVDMLKEIRATLVELRSQLGTIIEGEEYNVEEK